MDGDARVLTRENAEEVAAWCGGRLAGGAYELVALPGRAQRFASPGDTILRSDDNYTIIRGEK